MTPTEKLKSTIQILRSKISEERQLYYKTQNKFENNPIVRDKLLEGIKAVALYYNGEIVRVKHDLADWMNGHEVHGNYGFLSTIADLHDSIHEIPKLLGNEEYLKLELEIVQDLINDIEQKCYSER